MNELIVLGSGTSTGIPIVGCKCAVCLSKNPKNKRLRTSLYLNLQGTKILIDTTPDLRTQLLNHAIDHLDGVIITHDHADHIHGIDDLRPLSFIAKAPIPLFTDDACAASIEKRFYYIFDDTRPLIGGGKPLLKLNHLMVPKEQVVPHNIVDQKFNFFKLPHGHTHSLGFQVESLAYLIDCHKIPNNIVNYLHSEKLDLLIIDCCQLERHSTHLNRDLAFKYIQEIAPQRAGLIHMNHSLEHEQLLLDAKSTFSFPVTPLYDGQRLQFPSSF